tara:strand:+ start:162 stop:500 length:339 start_codon:yes stop_codon:yes gene_type:complete
MYTLQVKPLPAHTGQEITANPRRKYPFYELKPGKMFNFPTTKHVSVRGSLNNHNKLMKKRGSKTLTCTILRINKREHGCWCLGYNGKIDKKILAKLTTPLNTTVVGGITNGR